MQQKIQQLIQYFQGLTKREKIVLAGVAALLGVFIIVGGIVSPVMSFQSKIAKSVQTNDEKLRKVYEISSKLRTAQERAKNSGSQQVQNVTLFGFIEELASKARMNDRIEYMKPVPDPADATKEVVELKIRSVYQEDVINMLYDIEHSPYSIMVRRLDIRRVDNGNNLDVTFQVVRYG
jgi:type II secretory pathway component PulM